MIATHITCTGSKNLAVYQAKRRTKMAEPVTVVTLTIFFSDALDELKKGFDSFQSGKVMSGTVCMHPGGIIEGKVLGSPLSDFHHVEVSVWHPTQVVHPYILKIFYTSLYLA